MAEEQRATSLGTGRFRHLSTIRALVSDRRFAAVWLIPRVALGWVWLNAGWHHLSAPAVPVDHLTRMIATGETLAGIALILGIGTGLTALIGGLIGGLLGPAAGLATVDPLSPLGLAVVSGLMLGWRSAGLVGLDRWLLPVIGLSGRPSNLFPSWLVLPQRRDRPD